MAPRPKDKISFEVDQGTVKIKRRGSVVEQTAGALRSSQPSVSQIRSLL